MIVLPTRAAAQRISARDATTISAISQPRAARLSFFFFALPVFSFSSRSAAVFSADFFVFGFSSAGFGAVWTSAGFLLFVFPSALLSFGFFPPGFSEGCSAFPLFFFFPAAPASGSETGFLRSGFSSAPRSLSPGAGGIVSVLLAHA